MNENQLRQMLESVRHGQIAVDDAVESLRKLPVRNLGFARIDSHRHLRCGFPEVVYCPGKTPEEIATILSSMIEEEGDVVAMATRADEATWHFVQKRIPEATYHPRSGVILFRRGTPPEAAGLVTIVSAGTADFPVVEEATLTARIAGSRVTQFRDVGVAGVHRLLDLHDDLRESNVLVVVAGMEGALPSLVAGLVDRPVIAVPTSVGYGAHFHGLAPLLAMLSSCAPGVSVVNIDNGFAAGYLAALINQNSVQRRSFDHVDDE